MSDVMLFGVLRMPPDLWRDDPLDKAQRHSRYLQAADEIERLRARVAELQAHIDFFDPMTKCARCGVEERQTSMVPEEGNEWECFVCWERENARERAAHMKILALPEKP